jgi:hypothetical protein
VWPGEQKVRRRSQNVEADCRAMHGETATQAEVPIDETGHKFTPRREVAANAVLNRLRDQLSG